MKNLFYILLGISSLTHAGVSFPPLKYTYVEQSIVADGFDSEWDDQNLFQVNYEDMGLSLSINEFTNTYYHSWIPSKVNNQVVTGFLLEMREENNFKIGDEISIITKFKHKETGEYAKRRNCSIQNYSNGRKVERCSTSDIQNILELYRNSTTGQLRYKDDSDGFFVAYGTSFKNGHEYFEFYRDHGSFLSHSSVNRNLYKPVVIVTAKNKHQSNEAKAQMASSFSINRLSSYSRIIDIKPGSEAFLRDIPDYKPVVQVGVSTQYSGADLNLAIATDFRNLAVSFEPGKTIVNSDHEIEAFINVFATDDLKKVTQGQSTTVAGDVGLVPINHPFNPGKYINVGAQMVFDDSNKVFGGGLTVGAGLPDNDVSINYGSTIHTTEKEISPARTQQSQYNNNSNSRYQRKSGSDRNRISGYDRREGRTSRNRGESGRSIEN